MKVCNVDWIIGLAVVCVFDWIISLALIQLGGCFSTFGDAEFNSSSVYLFSFNVI